MNKTFIFIVLTFLAVAGASNARWYRGGWGGWGPGVSIGFGVGSGYGYWGPGYGYWGGGPYWGYSRPVYVYNRPARPSSIEIINNSNVTITVNGRTVQPGATITMRYDKFLNINSSAGSVELENPTDPIEVFQRSDGYLDADY